MILSAKDGLRGVFVRVDSRQPVRFVRWYNTETYEWSAFRCSPIEAKARGVSLGSILYRGRCRLDFVPAAIAPIAVRTQGRVAPSTPLDEIRAEVLKGGEIQVKPVLWCPGFRPPECDEPKCHRAADWAVAVEQVVEPERGPDGRLYERAVVIAAYCFCNRHYRPPRQVSQRGVEKELEEISARPQW